MTDPDDAQENEPISLDELAAAFAQVMSTSPKTAKASGERPEPAAAPASQPAAADMPAGEAAVEFDAEGAGASDRPADEACPVTPRTILEAMLFVGDRANRPLTASRAAELMRGVEPREVLNLIDELNRVYSASGRPYFIAADSDGFRMTLRKPFHPLRSRFYGRVREARLSQQAIDILAIVAYQQPLTADQISEMRGKPSRHVLSQLVHRGLLRIERLQDKRRTVQYFTTNRFLELFGLQTLADLPQSEELDRQ